MSDDRSTNWTLRRVLEASAQLAAAKDPSGGTSVANTAKPKTERFSLDYVGADGGRHRPAAPGGFHGPGTRAGGLHAPPVGH